jgi:hypothetical protein
MRYSVDMFEEIVANVRAKYDEANNLEPYFDYGHILDILSKLTAKDDNDVNKFRKYPLICLILDQKETHGTSVNYQYTFAPRLLIVTSTQKEYTSQDRTNNTFKPILYPIYDLLIEEVKKYKYFGFEPRSLWPHDKYDRYSWGASEIFGNVGVIFNDYLDGIEIISENINVYKQASNC